MILGTDAAGVLDEDIPVRKGLKAGDEVVLYTVIGADGAGVMPGERRTILSERYPGTMAAKTQVPSANVFAKPANLTLDEAAALGSSWLARSPSSCSSPRTVASSSTSWHRARTIRGITPSRRARSISSTRTSAASPAGR